MTGGKPDDIPQDVWDAADLVSSAVYAAYHNDDGDYGDPGPHELIARAILAAEKRGEERERERAKDMADCLSDMTEHYVALVNSGDAGFWNAEEEIEVQAARQMIAAIRNEGAS